MDFLDWVSLRLECPAGPAPYAVAGIRCALAARVPGIVWTGGDLEASFAAARPHRVLRRVSAARPYEELVAEVKAGGPGEWLAWTEVNGGFRLRRVRWALAEARRRTRAILVNPAVRSPGWWEVHGRVAEPGEACDQLSRAGAKQPGRLAALVDLEPEAIQLLGGLLERGVGEHSLEEEILKGADPGAAIGRLASVHGLVTEEDLARGRAPSPAMRAFGADRDRMRRGELMMEVSLRSMPRTAWTWEQVAFTALAAGDADVAHLWARRAVEADSERWKALSQALLSQGRYTEAESLLRRQLQNERTSDLDRGWVLHELGLVLDSKGNYAEAEKLLRQSLAIFEQTFGTHHPNYSASLHELARVLEKQGQYAEAEKLLRQSLAISEQTLGTHQSYYSVSLELLAKVLQRQDRYAEAEALLRHSHSIIEQALGPQHPQLCSVLASLGSNLAAQNRPQEGEALLLRSASIAHETWGPLHPETAQVLNMLAQVQAALKKPEAAATAQQAMDALLGSLGPEHPITKDALPGLRHIVTGSA
ncbi:MAG TPA: tetratricopeptide repeat protein [Archangium sp.]|nr:tetratricopeptide repeat protein [Archangium sp.]